MSFRAIILVFFTLAVTSFDISHRKTTVNYVQSFSNVRHPAIVYWFINPEDLVNEKYLADIQNISTNSRFDMLFMNARRGTDFYDYEKMRPIFKKIVTAAHQKGIKIGLQLWENEKRAIKPEDAENIIVENETLLGEHGSGEILATAKHARFMERLVKSSILKAFAFKKNAAGSYEKGSLRDITHLCHSSEEGPHQIRVRINGKKELNGYTVYLLSQHRSNANTNHSKAASLAIIEALEAYSDIPFDAVGLDEYTNLRVTPASKIGSEFFRERYYSNAMATKYKKRYGKELSRTLLDMRYVSSGGEAQKIHAINTYMDLVREAPLMVEQDVSAAAKKIFGQHTFIGLHNTHHNYLTGDEIWLTGLNWWSLPRYYGHSDEHTPKPTQLGIAMSYPANILYNMYYHKKIDVITTKALTDLSYGVRTNYHAMNDIIKYGVSIDEMDALRKINPVEECARLLNHFNPSLPEVRLLVIFGMESLSNWFPDSTSRGVYDINVKQRVEEKAVAIWEAGYSNALVSSDVIVNGRLKLNSANQPMLNGHTFDAIVYLNPEYARPEVTAFLSSYTKKGGKLMLEGSASRDFFGNLAHKEWIGISERAQSLKYAINNIPSLGIKKNRLPFGVKNEDGSFVFTDTASLYGKKTSEFSVLSHTGDIYTGKYQGLVAIKVNEKGLKKLAARGFSELSRNGKIIFKLNAPASTYIEEKNNEIQIIIADTKKSIKPIINHL